MATRDLELPAKSRLENDAHLILREALDEILQVTGASAGWIALKTQEGSLDFLVQRVEFPDSWIDFQSGELGLWGFRVHEGPVLLNEFPALPILGQPPLQNLLSCPLGGEPKSSGHIFLANKLTGFTSQDAIVLQAVCRVLDGQLRSIMSLANRYQFSRFLSRSLDHVEHGVLILDQRNALLYANETWCRWTGFGLEELLGSSAPFPFWVSHRDLADLRMGIETSRSLPPEFRLDPSPPEQGDVYKADSSGTKSEQLPASPSAARGEGEWSSRVPFRDRNGSLFWCQIAMVREEIDERALSLVYLRRDDGEQKPVELAQVAAPGMIPSSEQTLVLILPSHNPPEFWDGRWEKLTGLSASDLAGASRELLLDWLFPRERDRAYVADLLCQPLARSGQAVLDLVCPEGSRPVACTFLPVNLGSTTELSAGASSSTSLAGTLAPPPGDTAWLLLVAPPGDVSLGAPPVSPQLSQFARGLSQVLNRHVTGPLSIAESALDRADLSADVAALFSQVLEGCQGMSRLISSLQDLAVETVGQRHRLTFPDVVRECLDDRLAEVPDPGLESSFEVQDPSIQVEANPRMLRLVLHHLLSHALQAVAGRSRGRIHVRVFASETEVSCQIQDNGAGLPVAESSYGYAPPSPTKGSFGPVARFVDPETAGLSLTVCRHFLELHGGRLDLRHGPDGGAQVTFVLPRAVSTQVARVITGFDASRRP